jgi:hypothetical protein
MAAKQFPGLKNLGKSLPPPSGKGATPASKTPVGPASMHGKKCPDCGKMG